ncbi:Sensory neuron membrane protein 2 [Plutella xylostella]|uniref:Sensory neuron membrane protein 2 n=1 Tax=Plutella xylostella TaxID=51655 RepID=A0ABQ7QJD9_PLUXY|nr:Sensory neuron membrane protein 2 [Plutella xylostella]
MLGKHLRLGFAISLVVLVVAILMAAWGFPKIVQTQIKKNIQLADGSLMFDKWKKLPMPLTFKVYVFNVTNPDAVDSGERPRLQEVGPFVYKEYREKTILGYGENDTIKYTLKKTFIFDQEASGSLTEDDVLTVLNFSYMGALLSVFEIMPGLIPMINQALGVMFENLTDPFLRVKARDLFFDGIYLNCVGESSALGIVCGKIRADAPPTMRPSEDGNGFYFSMFSHMNLSEAGPFEMVRGTEDVSQLGHIVSYKDKTSMNTWGDKYCGQLNGSDSSIFPPIDRSRVPERLYTFEPDICRSLYASLVGETTHFNMSAFYYEIHESALAAKSANRDNKCFCRRNWSANHDGCLLMGLLNLMPCQGAPVIASLPHFYLASEELLEFFDGGVKPDKEKHNTYVYLDPVTGVILEGVRRLQFNLELRNMKGVPQLENVPTGLFPLLWIEEGAILPPSVIDELQHSHTLLSYVEAVRWIVLGIAILAFLGLAIAVIRTGNIPIFPKQANSVSFILRPGSFNPTDAHKAQ